MRLPRKAFGMKRRAAQWFLVSLSAIVRMVDEAQQSTKVECWSGGRGVCRKTWVRQQVLQWAAWDSGYDQNHGALCVLSMASALHRRRPLGCVAQIREANSGSGVRRLV